MAVFRVCFQQAMLMSEFDYFLPIHDIHGLSYKVYSLDISPTSVDVKLDPFTISPS